jgi:hypothetical protein
MPPVRKDKRPPSSSKSAKKYICTCGSSWKTEWARARHIGQFPEDSEGSKGLTLGPGSPGYQACLLCKWPSVAETSLWNVAQDSKGHFQEPLRPLEPSETEGHLQSKHAWYPGEPGPKVGECHFNGYFSETYNPFVVGTSRTCRRAKGGDGPRAGDSQLRRYIDIIFDPLLIFRTEKWPASRHVGCHGRSGRLSNRPLWVRLLLLLFYKQAISQF